MAWGAKGGRGVHDLVERLTRDDPSLTSLHVFASRKFGREEVQKLCQALRANATLKELYASGHHLTPQTAGHPRACRWHQAEQHIAEGGP